MAGILSIFVFPQSLIAGNFDPLFSRPVVVGERTVFYLTRSEEGPWALSSREIDSAAGPVTVPLRLDAAFGDLRLFVDSEDRLWLVGEAFQPGEVLIRIGRLDNLGFSESRTIGVPAGWNGQADLAFPNSANPWIAWRCKSGAGEDILVEDATSGLRWRLTTPGTSALSSPRIRADRNGGIWVIWSGLSEGRYVVAGRRFDGRSWSDKVLIDDNGDRPSIQLEAGSGRDGILRIAWSAYDGRYYKVRMSEWAGDAWSEPRTLTVHSEMETSPRIVGLGRETEAVVWCGLSATNKRILAQVLNDGQPADPFIVSDMAETPVFEAAGTDQGLFTIQENREGFRAATLRKERFRKRASPPEDRADRPVPPADLPSGLTISTRLESQYIGFGDSITFGYINRQEAPDRGYIPRLDIKLDAAFGPTTVVNSGFPGEYTIEGLARIDSVLAAQQGRYLLLMEGTNDVKHVATPIPTSIYNLKEICKRCLAAGVMPLLATVIPRRDDIWYYEYYQGRHYDLEAGIRAIAPSLVIPFVEMEQPFNDYPGGPDNLLSDYVHPNETGYVVMTNVWYTAIRALPFPPVNIEFLKKSKSSGQSLGAGDTRLSDVSAVAYLLTWEANPKIANIDSIKGFRIYRKKAAESFSSFALIGHVEGIFAFLDRSVDGTTVYDYIITTVTKDNVEGAGSAIYRR